jgi:hypothetical protein
MEFYYKYKENIEKIELKKENRLKSSLNKSLLENFKISIYDYLDYLGFKIEKCRVCKTGNPPIDIKYHISKKNFLIIESFEYTKKIYCYRDNKNCKGIKMNPNSFEFISLIENVTIEDAKTLLKSRNKSPFYKENWNSLIEYKESQKRDLNYFIKKYGENGEKKYIEYLNKLSYSNSIERYLEEHGEEGREIFEKISKSKDSMSFNYFLNKNKGDIKLSLFEYEKRLKSVNVSIGNLINKYGKKEGIIKHKERIRKAKETFDKNPNKEEIFKKRAITIENLFRKYKNIDKAIYIRNKWIEKATVPLIRASKESLLVFSDVIDWCLSNDIDHDDIYIGYKNKNEFFIKNEKDIYFYDFTIRSKKIIIEYNGVAFHPKNENSIWQNPFDKNITSKEAYNKQKLKKEIAIDNGFKLLEIWSDSNVSENIKLCIDFIKINK